MAYPQIRNMHANLDAGLTDGTYKKIVRDRGGYIDQATYAAREDLNDTWFGIHEAAVKTTPDNRRVGTPFYVETPAAHLP